MPDILHRVGIAAEPARVLEALASIDGVRGWWDQKATGGASEGEGFIFGGSHRMDVIEASPGLVRWRYSGPASDWVDTEVRFGIEPADDQTFVMFTHADWREPTAMMHHCSTKWAVFLLSLKDLLERGEGQPKPNDVRISAAD